MLEACVIAFNIIEYKTLYLCSVKKKEKKGGKKRKRLQFPIGQSKRSMTTTFIENTFPTRHRRFVSTKKRRRRNHRHFHYRTSVAKSKRRQFRAQAAQSLPCERLPQALSLLPLWRAIKKLSTQNTVPAKNSFTVLSSIGVPLFSTRSLCRAFPRTSAPLPETRVTSANTCRVNCHESAVEKDSREISTVRFHENVRF